MKHRLGHQARQASRQARHQARAGRMAMLTAEHDETEDVFEYSEMAVHSERHDWMHCLTGSPAIMAEFGSLCLWLSRFTAAQWDSRLKQHPQRGEGGDRDARIGHPQTMHKHVGGGGGGGRRRTTDRSGLNCCAQVRVGSKGRTLQRMKAGIIAKTAGHCEC